MSEYVEALDVWITQQKMPMHVKAFCKRKGDDNCVVLNQDLSDEAKRKAILHEVAHFRRNDLHSEDSVENIEKSII